MYTGSPLKKPKVRIKRNLSQLAREGTERIMTLAKESMEHQGFFTMAISGGSTPRPLHRLFVKEPYLSGIPWEGIHLFWVDERCVPVEDPASNYGTAKRDFFDRVPIPKQHIHPMPMNASPDRGAEVYQRELKAFFDSKEHIDPVFDLVILGIGTDGHTASLFPGQSALEETERWVVAVRGGTPDVYRLTLTLPIINKARHIIFLASGKEKSRIVKEILQNGNSTLPAQRIRPTHGDLTWIMDEEAASLLN
jgi:6-phosphogluconolactonase